MRIRIALAAAMAATFITSLTMSLQSHPAAAKGQHHHAGDYSLAAFRQSIPAPSGTKTQPKATTSAKRPSLTTALLTTDRRLFGSKAGTSRNPGTGSGSLGTAPAPTTTTTTAPPPPPLPPPPPPPTDATSTTTADWACIRVHESGDEYNDSARPSGAYGILEETWRSFGYSGWPYEASPAVQDALALRLYSEYGWQPWSTRVVCGL